MKNPRAYHEMMAYFFIVQIIGLLRTREYPIEFNIYTILKGFSYF